MNNKKKIIFHAAAIDCEQFFAAVLRQAENPIVFLSQCYGKPKTRLFFCRNAATSRKPDCFSVAVLRQAENRVVFAFHRCGEPLTGNNSLPQCCGEPLTASSRSATARPAIEHFTTRRISQDDGHGMIDNFFIAIHAEPRSRETPSLHVGTASRRSLHHDGRKYAWITERGL